MALELESLKKAIGALGRSLRVAEEQAGGDDVDLKETLRAGVVQNFEVAYEQTWKMMKRWLEMNVGAVEVDGVSRTFSCMGGLWFVKERKLYYARVISW